MSTFLFVGSAPVASTVTISAMGAFFGWFLVALLAFSVATLLPMVFASVYGQESDAILNETGIAPEVIESEDFGHREAA